MKVYLVEDIGDNPGCVYAVFAHEKDANDFASWFDDVEVYERTLFYGQPSIRGYNQ